VGKLAEAVHALAVAVWAGALWSVCLLFGPVLFARLSDRTLALAIDARLLLLVSLVGLACAAFLLIFRLARFGSSALRHGFFWTVAVMAALAMLAQFGERTVLDLAAGHGTVRQALEAFFRDRRLTWGGVPSLAYLVQCALAVPLVVLQQSAPR
jgi:hypothetical protein